VRRADGSLVYGEDVRNRDVSAVRREAIQFAEREHALTAVKGARKVDPERLAQLDRFLSFLVDEGVEVLLYLPPYHPTAYYLVESDPSYGLVRDSERAYRELAEKHGLQIFGDYDPSAVGIGEADFFDGLHAKPDAVSRIIECGSH